MINDNAMNNNIRDINKAFGGQYKEIGIIKAKAEAKQMLRFRLVLIGLSIISLCSIWS